MCRRQILLDNKQASCKFEICSTIQPEFLFWPRTTVFLIAARMTMEDLMFTHRARVQHLTNDQEFVDLQMDSCVAAGYTGRNQTMVQAHIKELRELGVPTPYAIPAFYWISPDRLTTNQSVYVVGGQTSPEVEFFLAEDSNGSLYITVASDHTDRELEAVSVGKAKQICDKVLGDFFWNVNDIADHWDEIQIRSSVFRDDKWISYQSGNLAQILHYKDLLDLTHREAPAGKHPALLSGTIPVIGGEAVFTSACEITLADPVLNRAITKRYEITALPDRS
jgi:hypothetical protein